MVLWHHDRTTRLGNMGQHTLYFADCAFVDGSRLGSSTRLAFHCPLGACFRSSSGPIKAIRYNCVVSCRSRTSTEPIKLWEMLRFILVKIAWNFQNLPRAIYSHLKIVKISRSAKRVSYKNRPTRSRKLRESSRLALRTIRSMIFNSLFSKIFARQICQITYSKNCDI